MTTTDKSQAAQNFRALTKKSFDIHFDLAGSNYEPVETIGVGAYGVVCSAEHRITKDKVAIKKIPCIFDQPAIAKRTYREIKILRHFKHDNIIAIREILKQNDSLEDVYIVLDLMESDLHRIIHSQQPLTEEHVRYFLYQLLRGLKYIHSANVIHRDLKPSNLLVNENCELKIGDFGMARGISNAQIEENHKITQYVATRWYRAPEIMLLPAAYTAAVDMWSVGCILAEMVGRRQIFPGKDYKDQLKLIIGILGTPATAFLKLTESDTICRFLRSFGYKEKEKLERLYPKASPLIISMLNQLLTIDPRERMTVETALTHPFLMNYHNIDDEPICVPAFNFDFEDQNFDQVKLREVISDEVNSFQKKKSKLNFIFKPVSKNELEKSQAKKNAKKSPPVSANQESVPPKSDVIMLSANTSLRIPDKQIQDVEMLSAKAKEEPTDEASTVSGMASMDTKARIIAALSSKKRHRVENQKEKPRPITALQRQREREERRRKKQERAQERKKKENMKEPKGLSLTDADKSLLERWKKLAQPTLPEDKHDPSNILVSQTNTHNTDILISQVPIAPAPDPPAMPFRGLNTTNATASVPFITYDANQPQNFVNLTSSVLNVNNSTVNPVVSFPSQVPFPALISSQNTEQIPPVLPAVSSTFNDGNVTQSKTAQGKASSSMTDSLSVITKQFKRSHVEDLTLTQTPKGTGGGYGVGFDIEFESFLSENRPQSACLSASLLTDWMELTDNIEIPNLEGALDLDSPLDFSNLPELFPK